ncbi:MAG: acetolactate synthase large subunit [Deltaproteobacteria bacterium]|nr:acetolactate synthase large subunit [Deltaproteobacteria bacterium]MBW2152729.1 acetolactate synthase large subunit [Deltaproteobacteria bacterium]
MNGAESLVQTLVDGGVDVCFTNPGTSEMHFVAAVDKIKGMRTILGLFEGVCTGAADGYARMAGKPAATLLHLGPGLGNAIANLHNARRANSAMINIVGDHATYHLKYNAPLTMDIEALAKTASDWVKTSRDAASVPKDAAQAVAEALKHPGNVATLILPADASWNESTGPVPIPEIPKPKPVDHKTIESAARVLLMGEPTILLLGGAALMEEGLWAAGRIARATGARIMANRSNGRIQRGAGRAVFDRIPYPVPPALKMLKGAAHMILVGAQPPVSFFAWRNMPNWLTPRDCKIHTLCTEKQDGVSALQALAEELDAPEQPAAVYERIRPELPAGELTAEKVWMALVAMMPEHAIISDEAVSSSRTADQLVATAPPHDWLSVTGGAIGQGLPVATGAAVACPDRKVFAMEADGSGMYTLQALWTQARERLDVVTILFANRSYRILHQELERVGVDYDCPRARELFKLTNPHLNWVDIAGGMGIHASRAETARQFNEQLEQAIHTPGPHLIEAII